MASVAMFAEAQRTALWELTGKKSTAPLLTPSHSREAFYALLDVKYFRKNKTRKQTGIWSRVHAGWITVVWKPPALKMESPEPFIPSKKEKKGGRGKKKKALKTHLACWLSPPTSEKQEGLPVDRYLDIFPPYLSLSTASNGICILAFSYWVQWELFKCHSLTQRSEML